MSDEATAGPLPDTVRRLRVVWWCALVVVCLGAWGARPLWDTDETRYALIARNMVESGDWFTPMLHGAPHMTKPPFTYWMGALAISVGGRSAWAVRLPLVVALLGTALGVTALARTWFRDELRARVAGFVFATSLLVCATGHVFSTDMFLTCFETLGVLAAWRAWRGGGGVWRPVCAGAFALAFLTKGPPGLIPLGVIAAFAALRARDATRGRLFAWTALVAGVVLALSWFVLQVRRDPTLARYWLWGETFERVATTEHGRDKPSWFYFVALPVGALPWTPFWPRSVSALRAAWRAAGAAADGLLARLRSLDERALFLLLWIVPPFLVFQLSGSKMPFYVTPLLVPASLAVTPYVARFARDAWRRGGGRRAAVCAGAALHVAVLAVANALPASVLPERNYVEVGRAAPAALPEWQERVFTIGGRPDSFTWVSGLELEPLYDVRGDERRAGRLADLAAEHGRVLLLLENEPEKRALFDALPVTLHELAANRLGVLVEVTPR